MYKISLWALGFGQQPEMHGRIPHNGPIRWPNRIVQVHQQQLQSTGHCNNEMNHHTFLFSFFFAFYAQCLQSNIFYSTHVSFLLMEVHL